MGGRPPSKEEKEERRDRPVCTRYCQQLATGIQTSLLCRGQRDPGEGVRTHVWTDTHKQTTKGPAAAKCGHKKTRRHQQQQHDVDKAPGTATFSKSRSSRCARLPQLSLHTVRYSLQMTAQSYSRRRQAKAAAASIKGLVDRKVLLLTLLRHTHTSGTHAAMLAAARDTTIKM